MLCIRSHVCSHCYQAGLQLFVTSEAGLNQGLLSCACAHYALQRTGRLGGCTRCLPENSSHSEPENF